MSKRELNLSTSSIFVLHDDRCISENIERIILILNIGKEHLRVCRVNMEKKEAIIDDRARSLTNKHIHSSTHFANDGTRISHER